MGIVLIGSIVTVIIVFVIPLAVLRAGIRRQERASLACRPPGLSAALTRRLVGGLYVRGSLVCDETESPTP